MILETSQLLSTAHRVLDGNLITGLSKSGRKQQQYILPDSRDSVMYSATHVNHPSTIWARQGHATYSWLYSLWMSLLNEYTHRYGKSHACEKLRVVLAKTPKNIKDSNWSQPPQAMPDECKTNDAISAYHQYYVMKKNHIAKWTNREIPKWYSHGILDLLTTESQVMGLYD